MVSTPKKSTTTRRKGKPKVDLAIAIDFGGSLTKIIGGLPDGKWCAVAMEPEVVQISRPLAKVFHGMIKGCLFLELAPVVKRSLCQMRCGSTRGARPPPDST